MAHIPLVIETFAALAEPSRLRIVQFLLDGPRPVNDIVRALRISQPQASKHLGVLKRARLVDVQPRAQQRLYGLRGRSLQDLDRWLAPYRRVWEERMDQFEDLTRELTDRETSSAKETPHGHRARKK